MKIMEPPMKKKKRLCSFKKDWKKDYDWLRETSNPQKAKCIICESVFTIGYVGAFAVAQHEKSACHKTRTMYFVSSSVMDKFLVKKNSEEEDIVVASEIAQIYHAIKHNHSYNSLECELKLNSNIFQGSKVAAKVSCDRTKCEAIVTNEKAFAVVMDDLKQHDPPLFFGIQTDVSNRKNMNMFPFCVQYFSLEHGTVTYNIDFFENADESEDGMFTCLKNTMDNLQLDWKRVSCLSADNANCNFGEKHSIYTNVRTLNDSIIKANCSAHIVHNTSKFALGNLNVDIENIVLKIYSHFSKSAKRRETLKQFHIFVETEFHEILRHVPTRRQSLHTCVGKILLSWKTLSSYFLSRPAECSKQLLKLLMIDNESTEVPQLIEMYLIFSQHVMEIFKLGAQELEKNETSTADVFIILTNLRNRLKS